MNPHSVPIPPHILGAERESLDRAPRQRLDIVVGRQGQPDLSPAIQAI